MNLTLTLAVRDLERTAVFYAEVLGLAVERLVTAPGHPPVLLLRCGDAAVLFRQAAALEAMHPALFQSLERHPFGVGVTLEVSLPALKPVLRSIDRHRLHTLYELEDAEHRRREVWLHDPDGYLLILTEEPQEER